MDSADILNFIEERQGVLGTLANDGRDHYTDARLTVFRSTEHFGLFVEMVGYSYRGPAFTLYTTGVSNCLPSGYTYCDELNYHPLLETVPDIPLWTEVEEEGEMVLRWNADRSHFSVIVRDRRYEFHPSPQAYEDAGILFLNDMKGPGSLPPAYLLRFLCHHLHHPFFHSTAALARLLPSGRHLELLIQTGAWQHPVELVNGHADDLTAHDRVSNIPCFQILSRAIANGDRQEWDQQDTSRFNTHWESLEAIREESLSLCGTADVYTA
jgi:hypothetical protein